MSNSHPIDRPIFIVGPHRSGTTLLYGIISRHEHSCFLDRYNHRFPANPRIARMLAQLLRSDVKPVEAQRFWDYLWPGPDDTMCSGDLTRSQKEFYTSVIARILEQRGRIRFVAKYPRLSLRVGWLDALFPDAKFLHMSRDWRAVVSSTLQRKVKRENRGGGWFGVRIPGWREMQGLPHELTAGRQFRVATLALEADARRLPGQFFRVDYADLCRESERVIREVAAFCELPFSQEFQAALPRGLKSRNDKWKQNLTPEMIAAIRNEDPEFFARYEDAE
jgi:omega-hydroxy-beta-dihydromenaquinone-9 sulfotransferase